MNFNIRLATKDEINILADLRMDFLLETASKKSSDEFKANTINYMQKHFDDNSFFCFVAEKENKIISTVMICFYDHLPKANNPTGKIGYLFNVYTLPEYRGAGIGAKVLKATLDLAKENGINEIFIKAEFKAMPLYKRIGFKHAEQDMVLQLF
ncbi:GNAT family N-acetyltransferase [Selenomonadales bacterium OttesenSCG-928-I06]|nr:GNAT family N-acetyltransferase [Selenomonadales bacterium OttesenSCG-928-I06]